MGHGCSSCTTPQGRIDKGGPISQLHPTEEVRKMKFYNSLGPNPRCVRMFMAEKGISIPSTEVNLMAADNRKPPYTDRNPGGQMPALELDNGSTLAETVAICEYLEEKNPTPALVGTTAEERAETRMWQRRIELNITEHL